MMQDRLRILLGTLAAIIMGAMGFAAHAQTGVTADSIVVGQSARSAERPHRWGRT